MRPLLILTLAFAISGAHAQTMFKCVDANGKTSYSDQPCSGKVVAKKEIDVRANLDVVEREARRKAEIAENKRLDEMYKKRDAAMGMDPQAQRMEREVRLMEGSDSERRAATYEQIKAETQKRVKADEEARAEASRLWNCKRGPEPEKCK
jgi:hypothetical protein